MNRISRQDVERAVAQLARKPQLGSGLEQDRTGRTKVKISGTGLKTLPDGSLAVDTEALAEALVKLAVVLLIDKRGRIAFSASAAKRPISLDATSGALQLDIGNALELDENDKLAVAPAVDPGDSTAINVLNLRTDHNNLLASLRTAGLIA